MHWNRAVSSPADCLEHRSDPRFRTRWRSIERAGPEICDCNDRRKGSDGGGNAGRQRGDLLDDETPIENLRSEIGARRHHKHDEKHIEQGNCKPFSRSGPRGRQRPNGLTAFGQKLYELACVHDHQSSIGALSIGTQCFTASLCILIHDRARTRHRGRPQLSWARAHIPPMGSLCQP